MKPFWINSIVWAKLTWKEQDYLILLGKRKYTKKEIMRKLYITTNMGFYKLQNRVKNKLSLHKI